MINSGLFWMLVIGGGVLLFIAPMVIGLIRDVDGKGLILLATAIGLVTGIGWVAAMWMAWALPRQVRMTSPPQPVIPPVPETATIPWPFPVEQDVRHRPTPS